MSAVDKNTQGDPADNADPIVLESVCKTVEDFHSPAAHDLISRYCANFLNQLAITPTELLHSAKYQKKLNDSGRILMNIVDRVATLQSKALKERSGAPRLKELQALISEMTRKTWEDDKASPVPSFKLGGFMAAVRALPGGGVAKQHEVLRMVTEHLFHHKDWKDKVRIILALLSEAEGQPEAKVIEPMLGEALRSEKALNSLFGPYDRMEDRLGELIDLYKGEWQPRSDPLPVTEDLNAKIAAGVVPSARPAIEVAFLRNLASKDVLVSYDQVDAEMQAMVRVFRRARVDNTLVGGARTISLIEKRMALFINNENLTDIVRETKGWCDKAVHLLNLNTIAIGPSNRATMHRFIKHYFGDEDFAKRLLSGHDSPAYRMQGLGALYKALKTTPLPEEDRLLFLEKVEVAQAQFIEQGNFFGLIEKNGGSTAQKAIALIDLARRGAFIEGRILDMARQIIENYVSQPDFMAGYLNGIGGPDAEKKLLILNKTLEALGIRR